jgi:hypothetical protein
LSKFGQFLSEFNIFGPDTTYLGVCGEQIMLTFLKYFDTAGDK